MSDFYWELLTYDGDRIEIPPAAVETVQRRWDNGQPIHTKHSGDVAASQIKSFRPTSKRYGQQALLEEAAQAFKEPLFNADGSCICRWVKKRVTQKEYENHYGKIPSYHSLGSENGLVSVAFFLPVDVIDLNNVEHCTAEEEQRLTKYH